MTGTKYEKATLHEVENPYGRTTRSAGYKKLLAALSLENIRNGIVMFYTKMAVTSINSKVFVNCTIL
ncbi:hypothetical protein V1477_011195 [Vespula maculifrons]|uniref:Uncharacterized protein n=1 Tax=Vespula maculifrons TaxID=7453 RepID=A0ABD2C439_VESMC